jgi:hypothetical protein
VRGMSLLDTPVCECARISIQLCLLSENYDYVKLDFFVILLPQLFVRFVR